MVGTWRLLWFAAWAAALTAQDTGRLVGSVTDPSGAAIPGAKVQLWLPGGTSAVLETETSAEGLFSFTSARAGYYDLTVEATGFRRFTLRQLKLDPGREVSAGAVKLEVGAVSETIEVTADAPGVQTTNAEVSVTVSNKTLGNLPLFDRNPFSIINTQPGVTNGGASGLTVINGMRTSYANVTIDGVNVQDNAVRANSLDFLPNLPFTDQIAELTVLTSNADATWGGGAAQVAIVTPSGSNAFHGRAVLNNRNNRFAANNWFNNKDGVEKPFLNRNQFGGSLSGYLIKNRLLFFANYEGFRRRQTDLTNRRILTADARQGIFTYRDGVGNVRRANVLQLMRESIDPSVRQLLDRVPGPERINNFRTGDSSAALLRNFAGYSFNIRDNRTRDNLTGKIDYLPSTQHSIAFTYAYNRDIVDRPDDSNDYSAIPKVRNDDARNLLSAAWRWHRGARLTNELRGGFNLAPARFLTTEQFGPRLIGGFVFDNPVNLAQPESRQTDTFNYQNNTAYTIGRHRFQFGFQGQSVRLRTTLEDGVLPAFSIGTGLGNPALVAQLLPGIGAADLASANALLASLAGYVDSYAQEFNVTSRTSGFVPGAPTIRNYTMDNYAAYFQDSWKLRPRVSLSLGLRWDYRPPVDERDALAMMPVIFGNDPIQTLLSNAILDFGGKAVNRPWYQSDRNNFAPNVALAWDVFGNGKTAVRAGYSMHYVNDEDILALSNNLVNTNGGLELQSTDFDITARLSNLPVIPVPRFRVPRTIAENQLFDPASAVGVPDPGLATPYVQQWNVGVQHEWRGAIFDIRYVGNHSTKMFRSFDYNQVLINENGFLADFNRARRNAELAQAARGVYDPRFNPNIAGSQALTVFPRLLGEGLLTNAIVQQFILTGQVAELAAVYHVNGLEGSVQFFRNPFSLGANMVTNFSNATYDSLQFDVRHAFRSGLVFQANYVFGKVLSDSAGESQFRFEPFLDLANTKIERARASYDVTHEIKANWVYELPFGPGKPVLNSGYAAKVFGGWEISGLVTYRSGAPFSILSGRGTFNRTARSGGNTAVTLLSKGQIEDLFQLRTTGDGPYFIAASAISQDGAAVAADGRPAFNGQVFFHPGPGQIGTLQRRMFSGPWVFDSDMNARKRVKIGERHTLTFEANAFSIFNNQAWFVGSQALDSVNFGRVSGTATAPRVFQFGLYYSF